MSLEDDVNKRINASLSQRAPINPPDIPNPSTLKEYKEVLEAFHKDIPYAHGILKKAQSHIQPVLAEFQQGIQKEFPIVKVEDGVSYVVNFPNFDQYQKYHNLVFGSFYYHLIWGGIYPTQFYQRKPLFGPAREWFKQDYASFHVFMNLDWHDNEFGNIRLISNSDNMAPVLYGTVDWENKYKLGRHGGYSSIMPLEQWLNNPQLLKTTLKESLENTRTVNVDAPHYNTEDLTGKPELGGP